MSHRRYPSYPDDADYTTNAPSYYEDLARKHALIKELAERIWGYEETLNLSMQDIAQRFIEWDAKIATFDGDVNVLLQEWLADGTFDHIINDTIFAWKANQSDVDSRLSYIAYDFKALGLKGDGVTNDSPAIQAIVNYAQSNSIKKITFPNRVYRLDDIIEITGDHLELDFSYAKILWKGTTILGNYRGLKAIFNIRGQLNGGSILDYLFSLGGTTAPILPPNTPTLYTLEKVNGLVSLSYIGSKIVTSNNSLFAVGDYILLKGYTKASLPYDATKYEPELHQLVKVIKKDATHIYTDYYPAFDYTGGFVDGTLLKSVAMKVTPIKNVKIKNAVIEDGVNIATMNAPTFNDKEKMVSPINHMLSVGVEIENVTVSNHKFPAVYAHSSRESTYKNVQGIRPQMWSGGEGYVIQSIGCAYSKFDKIVGEDCRHIIDHAGSTYSTIDNSYGINGKASDFSMHGMCEHDVVLTNCRGAISVGHGIEYFPEMTANIKLNNHIGGRLDVSTTAYMENLVVDDSDCVLYTPYAVNLEIVNSKIRWVTGFVFKANKRNKTILSTLKLDNNEITFVENGTNSAMQVYNYDDIEIGENIIKFDFVAGVLPAMPTIEFIDPKNINIINNVYNNISFAISAFVAGDITCKYKGNVANFLTKSGYSTLYVKRLTGNKLSMSVSDNDVTSEGSTTYLNLVLVDDYNKTNSELLIKLFDNTLVGTVAAPIRYGFFSTNDPLKIKTNTIDGGNIIKNKHVDSIYSLTKNLFI